MSLPRLFLVLFSVFTLIGCPATPEEEGDEAGECSDEADNDSNGLFDCQDEGCKGSPACKEDDPQTEGTGDGDIDGTIQDAGSSDGVGEGNTDGTSIDAGSNDGAGDGTGAGNTEGTNVDAGSNDGAGDGNIDQTTDAGSAPCEQSEEVCGVASMAPNYLCEDGETIAGPGPCERNEDGECHWTFVHCPEEQ
jgi:hypothetical protein